MIINKLDDMQKLIRKQRKINKDLFNVNTFKEKPLLMTSQSRSNLNNFIFQCLESADYNNIHTNIKKTQEL